MKGFFFFFKAATLLGGGWGEMTSRSLAGDTFHNKNSTVRLVHFHMKLAVSECGRRGGWGWGRVPSDPDGGRMGGRDLSALLHSQSDLDLSSILQPLCCLPLSPYPSVGDLTGSLS